MRQNIFSAMIQASASLAIAFLSIAIFRYLTPDQVALLRQHYFVPFALICAFSPANQNYLRSILFSRAQEISVRDDINSLVIVQLVTGGLLLAAILLSISTSGAHLSWLNALALAVALIFVLARTIVTGVLEFRGDYSASIILNNSGSAIPYFAAFSFLVISGFDVFYISTIVLNTIGVLLVLIIASRISGAGVLKMPEWAGAEFKFVFRRYLSLSLISVGSVVVYQGVEFCLYNYTAYDKKEVANYALVFSISAIVRQIILTAVQPLEREQGGAQAVKVLMFGEVTRPVAVEIVVYLILFGAVLALPAILISMFPQFNKAPIFVAPIMLGVLGSAIQQVYSVRMIARARTGFLGSSQVVLAVSCIFAVLLLNSSISLVAMVWLTSGFVWIRGCIVIPLKAEMNYGRPSLKLWGARAALSATLFQYYF